MDLLCAFGSSDLAMKGKLETADFLSRALWIHEYGVYVRGAVISHVAVFELPGVRSPAFVSDSGSGWRLPWSKKVDIVQNAYYGGQSLWGGQPRVAVLAATEMVNPKIPTTIWMPANLAKMSRAWTRSRAVF